MNSLTRFFQIPLVRFIVHFFLIAGLVLNIYNIYSWYKINSKVNLNYKVLSDLNQQNAESKNQQGYYDSLIYKEKYAKSGGFKNKNEDVIDTSLVETNDSKVPNYVPTKSQKTLNNLDKWIICFLGSSDQAILNDSSKTEYSFTPECRTS